MALKYSYSYLRKRPGRIKERHSKSHLYTQSMTATQSPERNHVEEKEVRKWIFVLADAKEAVY